MDKVSQRLLRTLDVSSAIEAEASAERNLVPDEPGWSTLVAEKSTLTAYIVERLAAGFNPSAVVEIFARKPSLGVRPIPAVGPIERIVYRALAEESMKPFQKPDRSATAYVDFVLAPVERARELNKAKAGGAFGGIFLSGPINYVVKADIASFYQYVDHGILYRELIEHGSSAEASLLLIQLLSGLNGSAYGLPQLLEPSDWLSEVYAQRLERAIRREGLEVWRFNDDFRLACKTYEDALGAVETLSRLAGKIGLSLNELKTSTPRFNHYMFANLGTDIMEEADNVPLDEMIGDYGDSFLADPDAALAVLRSATIEDAAPAKGESDGDEQPTQRRIDLRKTSAEDVRILRRALNGLAHNADARGFEFLVQLLAYVPFLTPSVFGYLGAVGDGARTEAAKVLFDVIENVSLGDWQRVWIASAMIRDPELISEIQLLGVWASGTEASTDSSAVRVACMRILARTGGRSLEQLLRASSDLEDALILQIGDALNHALGPSASQQDKKLLGSWSEETALSRIICKPALAPKSV